MAIMDKPYFTINRKKRNVRGSDGGKYTICPLTYVPARDAELGWELAQREIANMRKERPDFVVRHFVDGAEVARWNGEIVMDNDFWERAFVGFLVSIGGENSRNWGLVFND